MFDQEWIGALDAAAACRALADAQADLVEVECRRLVLAAHWLDLHAPVEHPDTDGGRPVVVLPGMERTVRSGAEGTPLVSEFACAEFAALQGLHPAAGAARLAKVANLRHRHPRLWGRVRRGEVPGWKALETARIVAKTEYGLSLDQARWVDEQTCEWIDTLPWHAYLDLVEARIIAADPAGAEARRAAAEAEAYVTCGKSNEYGLKTFIAKARAGDTIRLVAVTDRIAQILAQNGDPRPVGARRAAALGILANPTHALALLLTAHHDGSANASDSQPEDAKAGSEADEEAADGAAGEGEPGDGRADPDEVGTLDLHPAHDDADDQEQQPDPCPECGRTGDPADPAAAAAAGVEVFVKTLTPAGLATLVRAGLPDAVLHIHLTQHALHTGQGVARVEGLGPVTVGQVAAFLGHHNVKPLAVLDPAQIRPVDGYEFPADMREAALTHSPRDVFPFAASTSRTRDIDHPDPYLPPDRGGPPGQTRLDNAAPMIRFHHRLKTHGRWALRQPEPGSYLWRSPHGHHWLTCPTGTHPLPDPIGRLLWHAINHHDNTT